MNHKMGNVVPVLLLLGCLGIAASGCADGTGDADDPHAETTDTGAPLTDDHGTTATPDGQEGQDGHDGHDGHDGQDDQPRFYSAARAGAGAYYGGSVDAGASMDAGAPASDASATRSDGATVEEGDIYRVLADDRILNLNSYRGLQVLDVADTSNPTIIGRLKVTGTPVEMYVVGDRAVVLLNNWRGYYGEVGVPGVDTFQGGLMLLVDISDPTAPSVLDQSRVHGYIRTSRMVYDAESIAVYVAAHGYQDYGYGAGGASPGDYQGPTTVVQSYAITAGGGIEARSRLDLGGYVFDIQATPRVLMVAHTEWHDGEVSSRVSVVDISSASGAMVEGDDVTVKGRVSSKHNMSYYKGVLRVVSGGTDWQARTNHVETFDATDLTDISPVDHKTFGDGEDLYATLFLGNKAFFVTYLRVDPFHAFEITDEGFITERFEFIVSGWNDFFRPVFEETRLIGIGVDDARGNRNMAVSLYDITDLGNPEPMITRADVRASGSTWSEALWDDRAFSVLEGAVEATAEDGETVETGMVLLPFSGWDRDRQRYVAAVQIFTFSPGTLTQRGYMEHGTPVRRSFLAKPSTPANLSEQDLSLFNCADPDSPEELGRVELSPSYSDFFVRGDYGVRFKDSVNHYYYPGGSRERDRPPAELETVIRDGDPDTSETVAEVEVPAGSRLIKAGDMVVAVASRYQVGDYVTSVVVYDYSDPASPKAAGTLETDELSQGHYYRYDGYHDVACYDCGWWDNYGSVEAYPVGRNVVFVERTGERKLLGQEEVCRTYPDRGASYPRPTPGGNMTGTTWYSGSITCRSLDGAEPVCTGEIQRCTYTSETEFDCQPVDPDTIETRESCYTNERTRYWWRFTFHLLDLSDPNAPTLTGAVELPAEQEADSVFVEGDSVYASWLKPYHVEGLDLPVVQHWYTRVDFSDPSAPALHDPVNIPGTIAAVAADGVLFTRDHTWVDNKMVPSVNRLQVSDGLAWLQARHEFEGEQLSSIIYDRRGHLLVSHDPSGGYYYDPKYPGGRGPEHAQHLAIFDAETETMPLLSDPEMAPWASLRATAGERALLAVPGGLLVYNYADPSAPYPQSYFATRGWPRRIAVEGDDVWFAAGPYGIVYFDISAHNILQPVEEQGVE